MVAILDIWKLFFFANSQFQIDVSILVILGHFKNIATGGHFDDQTPFMVISYN